MLGTSLRLKKRRRKKAKNPLKKYTASPMQVEQFKYELSDPKNYRLRYDATEIVYGEMLHRAKKGWNFVTDVFGDPGIGKSVTVLGLWERWRDIIKELTGKEPKLFITFSRWQTARIVKHAKQFDLIIQDEDTRLSGYGARTTEQALSNILDIIRKEQICFIFVGPAEKTLSVVNFAMEVVLQNETEKKNLLKIYNGKGRLIGRAELPIVKDQKLKQKYDKLKQENIERIKKAGGRDSEIVDLEQLEEDKAVVLNFAQERGWDLKNQKRIKVACRAAGISGQNEYIDMLATYIDMTLEAIEDVGTIISMRHEEKSMVIHPGDIADKYREYICVYAQENDLERTFNDLIANHFEGKSYSDIASERGVNKNTISTNIKRAKRKIDKVSGFLWEQAIFSWILEKVEKHVQEHENLQLLKLVNGQEVERFPIHSENDVFAIAVNRLTNTKNEKPSIGAEVQEIFRAFGPNPPSSSAFDLFLSSDLSFLFLWLGGKSTVDFLFFSRSLHFVFDAKVSHQCYDKTNREITSLTIKYEKLLPQSDYMENNPDAQAAILFWSPRIGSRFVPYTKPRSSVTINKYSPVLERQLEQIIKQAFTEKGGKKGKKNPGKKKGRKNSGERVRTEKRKQKEGEKKCVENLAQRNY